MTENPSAGKAPGAPPAGEDPAALTGHILVVDDGEANRDMLSRRLQRQGHTTVVAVDGLDALAVLEREPVDMVLLDVMMPRMDGYKTLEQIKSRPEWRHVPVIMISALTEMDSVIKCITLGAEDYLPKPFNVVLLKARVGACLEKKRLRDQEQRAYQALQVSQAKLAAELAEAASYARSLLPAPLATPGITTDWQAIPSMELGGDLFGYHDLDPDRLVIYLFDVSGHGVGAALLSVSVGNALRSMALPDVDFGDPAAVLSALNDAFPMESHNNMYFTAWYGVYSRSSRELVYASGGHPPGLLVVPGAAEPQRLKTPGLFIGGMPGASYAAARCAVPAGSSLCVFSDGAYEVTLPGGREMGLDDLVPLVAEAPPPGRTRSQAVLERVRALQGQDAFADDFSFLTVVFS